MNNHAILIVAHPDAAPPETAMTRSRTPRCGRLQFPPRPGALCPIINLVPQRRTR